MVPSGSLSGTNARVPTTAAGPAAAAGSRGSSVVEQLKDVSDRRAYYFCVLALVRHADDPEPLIAEGRWHGEMLDEPRGANGFCYDPYFFLPALNATAAELDPAVKNASSHRAIALQQLFARLKEEA